MPGSLRFCMVTTFYPPYSFGGDGIFVHHLSNALAERGHRVEVIHSVEAYRLLGGAKEPAAVPNHPNVTVHGLDTGRTLLSPLLTQQTGRPLLAGRRIREILDRDFDVVNYHNVSLVGGPGILTMGRGIKIYNIHEYWLTCATHVLYRFNRAVCTGRRPCLACSLGCRRPPQLWRYTGLLRRALGCVDAFVAPSSFCAEVHRRAGLDIPLVEIPYFVPDAGDGGTTEEAAGGPAGPYFLYAGRLEKLKGVQTLIPFFKRWGKARLVVAGRGGYEGRLRRLAGGSPLVEFVGFKEEEELRRLYRGAVAVLVPSLCFECFALVVAEACREGTPVVARNRGGIPELVRAGGGGILYDTEPELASAVEKLLEDRNLRRTLGSEGRQGYQRNWTPERYVSRYEELIRRLGGGGRT